MDERFKQTMQDEISPMYEQFKLRRDEKGDYRSGYNNLWMKVLIPPDKADDFTKMQFRGTAIAGRIAEPAQKARFLELAREHTAAIAPVAYKYAEALKILLTDEANQRLWEMYKIARANNIPNTDLM